MNGGRSRAVDGALGGLIVASGALLVYVRTLYPGVVAGRDTAKFQFIGRILGTPHNPGYPLYVLITHVFSYVPIGSVAYRINLFSALCGAGACVLMWLVFRRQGLCAVSASGLAWAFGFGLTFWSQATQAEVYTLAALLFAAVLLAVVTWRETRADRWLLTAIGFAGLSLAHHTTLAMVAPALVVFVSAVDPRTIRRPKILLATVAFTLLGLLPYIFIVIRTRTGAPYMESQAHSFGELIDVLRSKQFASWFGGVTWHDVWRVRLPHLADLIRIELTWPGVAAAGVGLVAWAWRRDPLIWLCALGMTAIVGFAANYGAGDIEVFLIPAMQLAWMASAEGVLTIGRWTRRPALVPAVLTLGLAAALVTANWRASDHHRRIAEGRFLAAVLEAVPNQTSFVADHSTVDLVLLYGLYGEGAGVSRDLRYVPQDRLTAISESRAGRSVYVFDGSRTLLDGLGLEFVPVPLKGLDVLTDLCEWTHGETVILAGLPAEWWRDHQPRVPCFSPVNAPVARRGDAIALVGRGGHGLARAEIGPSVSIDIGAPQVSVSLSISAAIERSAIRGGAVDLSCAGCALYAVLGGDGAIIESHRLTPADDYRVPLRDGISPLYRVSHAALCAPVGNLGWTDVRSLMTTGTLDWRVDNYRPAVSFVDLVVAGAPGQRVTFGPMAKTDGSKDAEFTPAIAAGLPPDAVAELGARFAGQDAPAWLHVDIRDQGQFVQMRMPFTGTPAAAWVRAQVDLNNPRRAILCDAR